MLLGPSVSGRNYEVPAEMAAEVEAALPGSRTTTLAGHPGLDLRAGIARQLTDLGITAIDVDPRCTVEDRNLFSHRRDAPTGRLASWCGWNDRRGNDAGSSNCRARFTAVRARLARAAEAAGRDADEIELLPITKFFPATDVLILSHLGCAAFGESREQEAAE